MATPVLSTGQDASSDPQTPKAPTTSTGPVPSLVRRSSFEPMRIGLGSLPPPVFSRAPSGQRSVPAIEFLNQDSTPSAVSIGSNTVSNHGSLPSTHNAGTGIPAVLASGTNTPSVGLGNGSMTSEPWNLWSDSTVPHGANPTSTSTTTTTETQAAYSTLTQESNQAILNASNNSREDNELASALAAAVVLDKNHDKRSSIASRVSSSSRSNTGNLLGGTTLDDSSDNVPGSNVAASWPEGLTADPNAALQPQSFALDPNASPERRAGGGDPVSVFTFHLTQSACQ